MDDSRNVSMTGACSTQTRDWFLFTCEHGGNLVPRPFTAVLAGKKGLLSSHRGYDRGALSIATRLASDRHAVLISSTVSRLLVDLNRSLEHADLHHPVVQRLDEADRRRIVERFYLPYRTKVETSIRETIHQGRRVIHIGVHSFTPRRKGVVRRAEVGILYDPRRHVEATWSALWKQQIKLVKPGWTIRMNYPYRGDADGLTTTLRQVFSPSEYLGIELEINAKLLKTRHSTNAVAGALCQAWASTRRNQS